MEKITVRDMAQIALVAAIYVALTMTPPLNAISYGAYQFRISEMMNFMAFYKPKYIIGVTLGCMIANLFSFGIIDVFVGGGSTLVFLSLGIAQKNSKFFDGFKIFDIGKVWNRTAPLRSYHYTITDKKTTKNKRKT